VVRGLAEEVEEAKMSVERQWRSECSELQGEVTHLQERLLAAVKAEQEQALAEAADRGRVLSELVQRDVALNEQGGCTALLQRESERYREGEVEAHLEACVLRVQLQEVEQQSQLALDAFSVASESKRCKCSEEVRRLKAQLKEAEEERDGAKARVEADATQAETEQGSTVALRKRVSALTEEKTALQQRLKRRERDLERSAEELSSTLEALRAQVAARRGERETATKTLLAAEAKISELEGGLPRSPPVASPPPAPDPPSAPPGTGPALWMGMPTYAPQAPPPLGSPGAPLGATLAGPVVSFAPPPSIASGQWLPTVQYAPPVVASYSAPTSLCTGASPVVLSTRRSTCSVSPPPGRPGATLRRDRSQSPPVSASGCRAPADRLGSVESRRTSDASFQGRIGGAQSRSVSRDGRGKQVRTVSPKTYGWTRSEGPEWKTSMEQEMEQGLRAAIYSLAVEGGDQRDIQDALESFQESMSGPDVPRAASNGARNTVRVSEAAKADRLSPPPRLAISAASLRASMESRRGVLGNRL